MLTQTFEHNGVTFMVRQPTIFDEEMETAAWVDLCRALAKEAGITLNELSSSDDRLTRKYVQWLQVTTMSSHQDYGDVYGADIAGYKAWRKAILADGQALALKWSQAYKVATQDATDENEKKAEPSNGVVSSDSPEAEPATTN